MAPTTARPDALVVGAGPWGLVAALALAHAGARVGLLDDGRPAAGAAAAGMLAPLGEAQDDGEQHLLAAMRAGAAAWPAFAEAIGVPDAYSTSGALVCAARPEQIGIVRRQAELLRALGADAPWQTGSDLRELEPALAGAVAGGVALADEHAVDTDRLLPALRTAVRSAGVLVSRQPARRVEPRSVLLDDGERLPADLVVIAAGAGSGALVERPPLPVRPVRGESIVLGPPRSAPPLLTRVVRTPSVYLVPRADGRVVVGATSEESGERRVTAEGLHHLLDEALHVVPGLREHVLVAARAGLRPATPDGLPVLGADDAGLIWATGGYRHGIVLLPLVGDAVAAAAGLVGEPVDPLVAPWSPRRAELATCA